MFRFLLGVLFILASFTGCQGNDQTNQPVTVLMVLTSVGHLGNLSNKTGWYLPEAAHPWAVFKDNGVAMTWASPNGGEAPLDPSSVAAYTKDETCSKFLKDTCWKKTKKLRDVDPKDFDAVFVVGGYGVMWDLVNDSNLENIAAAIYDQGGIVSGVCHGPAALLNVILKNGSSLVNGKEIAGFTNQEEDDMGRRNIVPWTIEDAMQKAGANYTKGAHWTDHVAEAGQLITGQNPMSAKSVAKAVVLGMKKAGLVNKFDVGATLTEHVENVKVVSPFVFPVCGITLVGIAAVVAVGRARRRSVAVDDETASLILE